MARRTRIVDPLVSPLFVALARNLKRGSIVPDETPFAAKIAFNPPLLPRALVPFVESLDLALLADALRAQRLLYFHPAVRWQLAYLLRLQWDHHEWERLGWDVTMDDYVGRIATPDEVERVNATLRELIAAHVHAMLPDMELVLRDPPKQRGPRGGLPNPRPTDPDTDWIDGRTLHGSWSILRERLEPDARELLAKLRQHPSSSNREQLVALVGEVTNEEPDPLPWSALMEWRYDEPPPSNLSDDEREFWAYGHYATLRTTVDLAPAVEAALTDLLEQPRKRVSAAAYLAWAVLAVHLGATPREVRSRVEHYDRYKGTHRT
jgi:hypothetical protein